MHGNRKFDVIQTIEQGGQCHLVLNHISGRTLQEVCREEGYISKETFYEWSSQIIDCVGNLHRCRPVKIYQFLTPYTIIIGMENKVYLLDTEHENNREIVRQMFDRRIQSAFFPEESIGKRRPGVYHDLYTIGKTMQYMLAKTEASQEMGRLEEYRMERMIRKLTGPDGMRGAHGADDVKTMLARCRGSISKKSAGKWKKRGEEKEGAGREIHIQKYRKYLAVVAAVVVMIAGAQMLFSKAEASSAVLETGKAPESSAAEDSQSTELAELHLKLGLLYYERLGDYEASLEPFQKAAELSKGVLDGESGMLKNASDYEVLAKFCLENHEISSEDAEAAVQKILETAETLSGFEKTEIVMDTIRIYEKMEKREEVLSLIMERIEAWDEWKEGDADKRLRKELYERGADIQEAKGNLLDAIEMRKVLYEEASEGEEYDTHMLKLASLYLRNEQYAEGETVGMDGIGKCTKRAEAAIICAKCICSNGTYDNAQKEEKLTAILQKAPELGTDSGWQQILQEQKLTVVENQVKFTEQEKTE